MYKTIFSSRKIDYTRIILFIPIAWVAYNISMNLIIKISTKNLIETIGVNIWRYGIDFLLLIIFVITGTLVVPKKKSGPAISCSGSQKAAPTEELCNSKRWNLHSICLLG